jgi:hypothetical protein
MTPSTEYWRTMRTDFSGSVSSVRLTSKGRRPRSCSPRVKRSKTSKKIGLWKLLEISPISFVRPVVRLEANALG